MKKKNFPTFWYDSNCWFGQISSIKDLNDAIFYTTDKKYGIFESIDEFLNKSVKSHHDDFLSFGTRIEHDTDVTLRQYLTDFGINVSLL